MSVSAGAIPPWARNTYGLARRPKPNSVPQKQRRPHQEEGPEKAQRQEQRLLSWGGGWGECRAGISGAAGEDGRSPRGCSPVTHREDVTATSSRVATTPTCGSHLPSGCYTSGVQRELQGGRADGRTPPHRLSWPRGLSALLTETPSSSQVQVHAGAAISDLLLAFDERYKKSQKQKR